LPVGSFSATPVKPLFEKYFCFSEVKSGLYKTRPVPTGGALAIVNDVERDAMDARPALTNAAEAYGKIVWS
jgi:hypothetical protein